MTNTASPPAPRQATGKQGAVILLGGSLTIVGSVMIAPVLPKIGAEFGPTTAHADALVPLVAAGPALTIALFAPIAGWMADRFGRKAMLMLATLLYALLGAAPSQLNELSHILATRLLFGCAEAMVMTCCTTLIGDYWQGADRSRYVGRQVVTIAVIGSIFFVLGGAVGETSWRAPFLLYLLPLLLLPVMAATLWEPTRAERRNGPRTTLDRAAWGRVATAYTLIFLGMLASFIVPVQSPVVIAGLGVTSSTLIGLCAGLGLLATLAGAMAWPLVRRRIGTAFVNALLLGLLAVGLWLMARADSYNAVLVAVAIHGFGGGMLVPNALAPLLENLPESARARGVGGFTSCLYLGQFVSPIVIAIIAATTHSIPSAIAVFSVATLALAGTWLLVGARRARPAHGADPA
ncbi:MFS transporter [Azospirillum griseum]|uniref:MFS-type drug efflux transporter P55 n=1 Tax=Azospirillum griseum TaxID=2496639 RepID=A0A3S0KXU1_9PROT|nr:MFS transporter [Azospirillum griseum]RTR19487.1 MFS transporter [Azospirillum griseum]